VKPAPFDYEAPDSIEAACAILSAAGGGATILAGGQTLMPLLNLRMSQPFILIDINRIAALSGIEKTADGIRIGPATRQVDALNNDVLAAELPVLVTALSHVGHHQTRNRGTVGGSVALGEPAAEMPATAVALGATIDVQSAQGRRRIAAREFYIGPFMTVLEPDELVTDIRYPAWAKDHIPLFAEVAQRPGDFALVGLVGALEVDAGKISRAGIAWFGMGPTPVAAQALEAALIGQDIATLDPATLADTALFETAPFDDHHASADYRRTVGRTLFIRTLRDALGLRNAA
jgi:aerobic carbon-monoxide dehydrogenase medium subunit